MLDTKRVANKRKEKYLNKKKKTNLKTQPRKKLI
jgi:hypothetical protein